MAPLWLVQQSLHGLTTYFGLADRDGGGSLVRNLPTVLDRARSGERPPVVPELAIADAGFDLDFFEDGLTFASDRLIEAMGLPAGVVEMGEVDDRACTASVRRMGYRTLELRVRADLIDRERSDGSVVEWTDEHGSVRSEWMTATPEPNRPTPRVRWRDKFEPPADLFLIEGSPWRVATDALAARVAAIDAVGIDFVDPIASAATGDLVVRRS